MAELKVKGPDALKFLSAMSINGYAKFAIGKGKGIVQCNRNASKDPTSRTITAALWSWVGRSASSSITHSRGGCRMRNSVQISLFAMLAACAGSAHGGPPMVTDDPGTPGDGHWEVNIAWTVDRGRTSTGHEAPLLDINYGVGERLQLKYEIPWVVLDEAGGRAHSGLGNSLLGVKWRFFDAGERGWQISAYPQIEVRNPGSDSVDRGLADAGTTVLLPFQFQREFERLTLNFDVGGAFHSRGDDEWFGGIVLARDINERLNWLAEVHADASAGLDRSALLVNFGTSWKVSVHGTLLAALGRELHDDLGERANVVGYVGWQMMY